MAVWCEEREILRSGGRGASPQLNFSGVRFGVRAFVHVSYRILLDFSVLIAYFSTTKSTAFSLQKIGGMVNSK